MPRFSVIITSYNQREFIPDAVDSALALRNLDREVIVVDDGSTDGSARLLEQYGDRIHLIALAANRGKGGARNAGADAAVGAYLVFLDGDDAFLPYALDVYERVIALKAPELLVSAMRWVSGRFPTTLEDTPPTIEMVVYDDYLKKDRAAGISASSLVIERQAFLNAHGWAPDLPVMQDQDMVLRLSDATPAVLVLAPPSTFHRAHPAQTVWHVPPFLPVLHEIIRRERSGQYPGGTARRKDRAAMLGALVFFWARRALRAGLYWDAVKLLVQEWPMAAGAAIRRARVVIGGRRRAETVRLPPS